MQYDLTSLYCLTACLPTPPPPSSPTTRFPFWSVCWVLSPLGRPSASSLSQMLPALPCQPQIPSVRSEHGVLFYIRNLELWRAGSWTVRIFCHWLYLETCASVGINHNSHRANLVFAVRMCKSVVFKIHLALWSPLCRIGTRVRQVRHQLQAQNLRRYQKKPKKTPSVIQINNILMQCLKVKMYAKNPRWKRIERKDWIYLVNKEISMGTVLFCGYTVLERS